jgi:hypothetical protein
MHKKCGLSESDWIDLAFWFRLAVVTVLFIAIGILAGYFLNTLALVVLSILCLLVTWLRGNIDGDAIPFLCATLSSVAAWMTLCVVTDQHWVGDFLRDFILR